eukprot:UN09850
MTISIAANLTKLIKLDLYKIKAAIAIIIISEYELG